VFSVHEDLQRMKEWGELNFKKERSWDFGDSTGGGGRSCRNGLKKTDEVRRS